MKHPSPSENAPRELGRGIASLIAALGGAAVFLFLRVHLLWRVPNYAILGLCCGLGAAGACGGGIYWVARRRGTLALLERLGPALLAGGARCVRAIAASGGMPSQRRPQRAAILCLVAAGFAAHAFLLLNDGTYFDGWLVRYVWVSGEHEILRDFFSRVGIPLLYATHFPHLHLPDFPLGYQLTSFVFLIANAILAYLVLLRIGVFSQGTAFLIALLELTSPLFFSTFEVTTNQYTLFRLVFMLSLFMILGPKPERPLVRLARGSLVTVLLWISFNLNSLLVVFYPLLALISLARNGREVFRVRRFWLTPWRLWLLAQPVLHWVGKRLVHPPHGDNVTNNRIIFLEGGLSSELWTSPAIVLGDSLAPLKWIATSRPLILGGLVAGVLGVVYGRFRREPASRLDLPAEVSPLWLVASGALLVVAGTFPYLSVGRAFPFRQPGGAHYNLLLALPCAMILTGLVRALGGVRWRALGTAFLIVVAGSSSIWLASSYLRWQVRGIRAEALVRRIRELPTRDYPVLGATSTMRFGDERDQVNGYTLTFLLASAHGEFRSIVIPDGRFDRSKPEQVEAFVDNWRLRPYLVGVERAGPQAQLVLAHGPGFRDDTASVFEYYRLKYLDPDGLPSYLSGYVSVKLVPGPKAPSDRKSE